jgi:hypothetical protein
MKVKELIEALNEQPQEAEVFYLPEDAGLHDVSSVMNATNNYDELREVVGDEFVIIK